MQTINDGTHAILPAATPIERRLDRARVPVTMLRQSDGKLRRDGSGAASVQPKYPVAERGRVQGALELKDRRKQRVAENNAVYYRSQKEKRRWRKDQRKRRQLRGQDKGTWHHAANVLENVVVCTLVRCAASGTPFLGFACRDLAQSLGFAGF
ncbi:hypothetical protein ECB98_24875 [Brucellaceae bacterium VT-16-1752]|nr:hypothetical protein ECB98_24875 [Brucellaceae bacterium VT-16-1752]